MSGSGIGRGRGWLNINKNQCQKPGITPQTINYDQNCVNTSTVTPMINSKYTTIINKLSLFNENDDGIMLNQKLKSILEEFNKVCQSAADVEEAFGSIHEKCLHDEEFAGKAIGVVSAASFNTTTIHGVKLRNSFITQFQKDFDDRKQLQKSNSSMFRNRVKMIGDFLHKARLPNGCPMAILTGPVLQYLDMLLESTNDQDLQLFTTQIFMNGNIIKEESPEQLLETMIQVREILATNDKLSTIGKYWLMMSIEISNYRYGFLPNEVNQFYVNHLGDKAMSQIKKLNTELLILTSYQNMKLDSVENNVSVLQTVPNAQNWETEEKQNRPQQSSDRSFNNMPVTREQPKQEKTPRPILGVGARLKHEKNEDTNWREQKTENDLWDTKKKIAKNWNPAGNNKQRKNPKGWEHDDRLENEYN